MVRFGHAELQVVSEPIGARLNASTTETEDMTMNETAEMAMLLEALRAEFGPDVDIRASGRSPKDGSGEVCLDPSGCAYAGLRQLWIQEDIAAGLREPDEYEELLVSQLQASRRIQSGFDRRDPATGQCQSVSAMS